ncbi:MAG TPA: pitrilysin family protein [Candidatus Saccharimonadales bacterium]|nr:pitrilysin family protein [Candidatus Saccharimonadales bacterium]
MARPRGPQFPIETHRLDNGLTVVLSEDHGAPVVATNLWYHVGSKNEPAGKTGFAHLFEHLLFEGSQHVPDKSYIPTIQRLGGDVNGSTGPDTTDYYETVPSEYLPLALWLESDRMGWLVPAMSQEKLDNQRSVVKNERRWRYDNQPYGRWLEHFLELAYPEGFPYRHPVIGSMEDLDSASLADVERFFETYYAPENAVLSVVGDFRPRDALRRVEKNFGAIPRGPGKPPVTAVFPGQSGEQRRVVPDRVQLPRVYLGFHAPGIGDPGMYPASVLTDVLSAGKSSRLYLRLVYEQQIAQHASSFLYPMELDSLIFLEASAKPGGSPEALEAALLAEIRALQEAPPPAREMERIRNQIATHQYFALQSVNGRADQLSECAIHFGDASRMLTEVERYLEVTAEEVQAAAQRLLVPENRTVVTFVPQNGGSA